MMKIRVKLFRKDDERVLERFRGQEYLPKNSYDFLKETRYLKVYYTEDVIVICEMGKSGNILNTHSYSEGSGVTVLRVHKRIYGEHINIKFLVNPLNKPSVRGCNYLVKNLGYKREVTKDYFYLYSK